MKYVLLAFQFLTIIPIKTTWSISEKDIARSAIFFPIVGAFQGMVLSISCIVLNLFFSSSLTAGIIILFYVLQNGGFHLDGLADTCDALSVKSTGIKAHDIKKRLKVMADSATGAIGATAICLDIILKYLLIKELFVSTKQFNPYLTIFLIPVFSKWAMVFSMYLGKSAKSEGLGNLFSGNIKTLWLFIVIIITFSLYAASYLFISFTSQFINPFFIDNIKTLSTLFIASMICICIVCFLSVSLFTKRFGGLTGDNFGAIHEFSELIFPLIMLLSK